LQVFTQGEVQQTYHAYAYFVRYFVKYMGKEVSHPNNLATPGTPLQDGVWRGSQSAAHVSKRLTMFSAQVKIDAMPVPAAMEMPKATLAGWTDSDSASTDE
jgi:hypothetical protein